MYISASQKSEYVCYKKGKAFNLTLSCSSGNVSITSIDFRLVKKEVCSERTGCCPNMTHFCPHALASGDKLFQKLVESCNDAQSCTIHQNIMFNGTTELRLFKTCKGRELTAYIPTSSVGVILVTFNCLSVNDGQFSGKLSCLNVHILMTSTQIILVTLL